MLRFQSNRSRDGFTHVARRQTHRLVVPSAFLPVLRAEQTTTTLFFDRLALMEIPSARCPMPNTQYPI